MKVPTWLSADRVWVEITPRGLRVQRGMDVREWPLERGSDGSLAAACRERILAELPVLAGREAWRPRGEAWCGLPAGGVTLRRWRLPKAPEEELERVLRLQMEGELPLPPEALAWGWQSLAEEDGMVEVLVAALKRDALGEYAELLEQAGLRPVFTLGALARSAIAKAAPSPRSVLDFGEDQTEWLWMDEKGPRRLRVIAWGEEAVVRELERRAGLSRPEAVAQVAALAENPDGEVGIGLREALGAALDGFLARVPASSLGSRVQLSGRLAASPAFRQELAGRLGSEVAWEYLEPAVRGGCPRTATLRGLEQLARSGGTGLLRLGHRSEEEPLAGRLAGPFPRRAMVGSALLLLAVVMFPYLEALLLGPRLAARVAAVKAGKDRMAAIDRSADFLRYLKLNQAPYLETLLVLGNTAPRGARIDSLQLNRKGELTLRMSMRQPQEATEFRSRLSDSGFFSSVVVEEQAPTPDRQKLMVRLSAVVKPPNARENLPSLSTNAPAGAGRPTGRPAMPGMPMPGVPMPGVPMPGTPGMGEGANPAGGPARPVPRPVP